MSEAEQHRSGCQGGCPHCATPAPPDGLHGWRLALSAGAVFLAPLALSAAGAGIVGGDEWRRWLGALGGLALGLVASVVVARLLSRTRKEAA